MNASHWYLNILCRQHGEKVMNFSIYCSLYHIPILFFKLKNIFIPFTLVYPPSNIFRAYITLVVKLEHHLWIARLGDYCVWMLTNPISSKHKHNSGGGVGIWTDSEVTVTDYKLWESQIDDKEPPESSPEITLHSIKGHPWHPTKSQSCLVAKSHS